MNFLINSFIYEKFILYLVIIVIFYKKKGVIMLAIKDDQFEAEVLKEKGLVLVDFWAEWCGPCRMIAPTIEEIAKEYEGRVKVGKINVDAQSELAIRYHIDAIPALMIFQNGAVVETRKGLRPKSELCALLNQVLQ